MKYDDVIEATGAFGWFQCYSFILFGMFASWSYLAVATPFIVMEVDHWCHVTELNNFTKDEQRYIAIPYDENGHFDKCRRFDLNISLFSSSDLLSWNRTKWSESQTVPCESWNYDISEYQSSAVISYNLVCDNRWLVSFSSTLYLFGALVGTFVGGVISDKYGRKKAIMLANAITISGCISCVLAPNYVLFGLGRIIAGMGRLVIYAVSLIYILEVTGKNFRGYVGLSHMSLFGIGYCIMAWVAKALKNDIHFQLALTLPSILYFSYWWIFPESPRWLLVNKRYNEATKAIHHIAKINRRILDSAFNVSEIEVEGRSTNRSQFVIMIRLFKGPILRKRILVVLFLWFTIVLQYYAVSLNVATIPGDIYLVAFYMGLMDIIGPALCMGVINWRKMGRRVTLVIMLVGTGVTGFICLPLLHYGYDNSLLGTVLFGRLLLTVTFGIVYFYTPELFPTEVRNSVLGAASTMGRVSGMMAAFIGGPLANVWWALPNVIYGVMGTSAGLLCLLLPETLGQRMCETIDEAEERTNITLKEENFLEDLKGRGKEAQNIVSI